MSLPPEQRLPVAARGDLARANPNRRGQEQAALGTVAIVVEWENAGSLLDETAAANIMNLAERIVEAADLIAGAPTLVMVSDPHVNSRAAYETVLMQLRQRFANQMTILAIDSPGGEYTDQKIAGVAASQSDLVVFADSDVRYRPNWLRLMLEPFHQPGIDYVHGRNVMMVDDLWGKAAAVYWFYPIEQEVPDGPTFVYFSNLAIRRSAYQRYPFPGNPGNRVACAIWCRGLATSGLVGKTSMAIGDHPPARGMAAVHKKALDYAGIDDGRYVARQISRPGRLFRASVRLVREILHSVKRSVYVGVTLRLSPLTAIQTLGIGLYYAALSGGAQMATALTASPAVPSVAVPPRRRQ